MYVVEYFLFAENRNSAARPKGDVVFLIHVKKFSDCITSRYVDSHPDTIPFWLDRKVCWLVR